MEFFQVQPAYAVGKFVLVLIGGHDIALCVAYVKIGTIMIPVTGVEEMNQLNTVFHQTVFEFGIRISQVANRYIGNYNQTYDSKLQ